MQRISDMRTDIQTIDQARELFDDIAMRIIKLAVAEAKAEQRIAAVKAGFEQAVASERAELATLEKVLARYIEQHSDQFEEPRKVKTSFGSFGLQAVNELLILNQGAVEQFVVECKFTDCYEKVIKLCKTALRKRLEQGFPIAGIELKKGDTAVYKVTPAVIKQHVERAIA